MKPLMIAGNWKSHKTVLESVRWLTEFTLCWDKSGALWRNVTIVLCVPYTALLVVKEHIVAHELPLQLGAQNVSPFAEGAETGEESAGMVRELADWVIVGHSERRKNFGETDDILAQKVQQAKAAGLKIIYCVPDDQTKIPAGVPVVAYEPVWAIGSGKTDSPENADTVIKTIKAKSQASMVLYGGSVTAENVKTFVTRPNIDGVLPGGASLDPESFAALITAAALGNI